MLELTGIIIVVVILLLGTITQILLKKSGRNNNKAKNISFIFYAIAMVLGIAAIVLYFA